VVSGVGVFDPTPLRIDAGVRIFDSDPGARTNPVHGAHPIRLVGMRPGLRRYCEVLPPAVLTAAVIVLAGRAAGGELDVTLLQLVLLLAWFEFVSSMVGSFVALRKTLDLRAGCAIVFVTASAALVAVAGYFARAPLAAALACTLVLVSVRFAAQVADAAHDELARLRAAAVADDRLDSVRAILGAVPFLAMPLFVLGLAIRFWPWALPDELPVLEWVAGASFLLATAWSLMLAAAAWHAYSPRFAQRPQRLFVHPPWPSLTDWYDLPHRRQQYRRERLLELREARKFARRIAADEKRARGPGGPLAPR
jgi:hypothetical protein